MLSILVTDETSPSNNAFTVLTNITADSDTRVINHDSNIFHFLGTKPHDHIAFINWPW